MHPKPSRPVPAVALAFSVYLAACLSAASASAAALSFVAVSGTDTGDCSNPATPCRSVNYALGQTTAGGEIKLVEPGNYGDFAVIKSITITGARGAAITRPRAGNTISITAGAAGVVTITGLIVNGMNAATNGILVNSVGHLNIKDCVFKNLVRSGVLFTPTVAVKFAIDDTLFAANNIAGVYLQPQSTGSTSGVLHRVTITGGGGGSFGVLMVAKSQLRISDSLISNHGDHGVYVPEDSTNSLWLSGNTITQNTIGFGAYQATGGVPTVQSAGNNFIAGNTTDVATGAGTLQINNLGPQ